MLPEAVTQRTQLTSTVFRSTQARWRRESAVARSAALLRPHGCGDESAATNSRAHTAMFAGGMARGRGQAPARLSQLRGSFLSFARWKAGFCTCATTAPLPDTPAFPQHQRSSVPTARLCHQGQTRRASIDPSRAIRPVEARAVTRPRNHHVSSRPQHGRRGQRHASRSEQEKKSTMSKNYYTYTPICVS